MFIETLLLLLCCMLLFDVLEILLLKEIAEDYTDKWHTKERKRYIICVDKSNVVGH